MILEGIEFDSIWQVAHKWVNKDPNVSNAQSLHPSVSEKLQRIARAAIFRKISLRNSNNMPVLDFWIVVNMMIERKLFWGLRACYFHQKFDKSLLDSLYVSRAEVLRWCESEYLSPPQFWLEDNQISKIPEKIKDSPASKRDKAEAAWKAFAQALWLIDPRIHPSHIAKSEAIRQFENVKDYTPDTVRDWIVDLDPLKDERNTGAPPKVEYLIDLKTGGLNKKA
jgi:hypothetical protein